MILPLVIESSITFFGIELINLSDFIELIMRFIFNLAITIVIVRYIYYPTSHKREYLFTFILIGTVIFLMSYLLEDVKIQLGFALGLFAIFGIIRYRTTTIPIKEMTYLFTVIGISVINALSNKKISYAELIFTNLAIMSIAYFIEKIKGIENESFTLVQYENIELVTPQRKDELIKDLEKRMGIKISRIEINNFDYQHDIAKIRVYFFKSRQIWAKDNELEYKTFYNE